MNKGQINTFIDKLFKLKANQITISEELEKYLLSETGSSIWEVQEKIERLDIKVKSVIRQRIESHKKGYTIPEFHFSDYSSDILVKSSVSTVYGEKEKVELKLFWRSKILELLKCITWRDFENISRNILYANNITEIEITQSSNDQGLDFWGYGNVNHSDDITRFQRDLNFRIVGQVKHSAKEVKVNHAKVSSFGTELNRLRTKDSSSYFVGLPDDFFKSNLPLIGLFITNSDYSPKAVDFSDDYGMILWNGRQVAEDLSNSEFLNLIKDSSGELSKDELLKQIKNSLTKPKPH